MNIKEMLRQRKTLMLEWCDPWPGIPADACVWHRATVSDCIAIAKASAAREGRALHDDDESYLLDFIAVMWATPVDA